MENDAIINYTYIRDSPKWEKKRLSINIYILESKSCIRFNTRKSNFKAACLETASAANVLKTIYIYIVLYYILYNIIRIQVYSYNI